MSSKLQENLSAILAEKLNKVKPENIKYGNTIFGVEGVAGKANVYLQRNEPTEKEGIWIQAKDLSVDHIILADEIVAEETWETDRFAEIDDYRFFEGPCIMCGNKVYMFTDWFTDKRYIKVYNLETKEFEANIAGSIYYAGAHGVGIDTTIYIFGNRSTSTSVKKMDVMTNTLTELNPAPYSMSGGKSVTDGTTIYIAGAGNNIALYDIETDSYTTYTATYDLTHCALELVGTKLYIFGGTGNKTALSVFDLERKEFTIEQTLPFEFFQGDSVLVGSDIYLFSGTNAYKYNIVQSTFVQLENISYSFTDWAFLYEGDIYLFGGSDSDLHIQRLLLDIKEYPDNSILMLHHRSGYATQMVNTNIDGRLTSNILNAWHYTTANGLNKLLPTSYGDGEKWVCFKNEDLLLPDEIPEEEEEIPLTVSYIESDGTQYIDTGIMPADDVEFEISFNHQDSVDTNHSVILGARAGYKSNSLVFFNRLSGSFNSKGIWIGNREDITATTYTHYQVDTVATFKNSTLTLTSSQGTESHVITMPSAFTGSYGIILFGSRLANSIELAVKMKLYYCKIWKAGELVRDFVPHLENGEYCLLDNVSGEVFLSPNGISFTGYSERSAQVEYVQSLGEGEYIDTGIVPTANTEVEIQFEDTEPFIDYERLFAIDKQFGIMRNLSSTTAWRVECGNSWLAGDVTIPEGGIHTVKMGKNTVLVDGENSFNYSGSASTDKTLYLFQGNGTNEAGAFKLYYFKVWEDGTLIRDFVPYIVDDVYCLKDLVSGQYFYTQNGSPLIGGEPIPVLDYTPLESVTLTKPFMTDYAPCSNTRVVLDYIDEDTTLTYYQNLVGASNGTRVNTQMLLQRVSTSNEWRAYFGTAGDYGHEVVMNNNIRYVFDWNKNNIYIDGVLGTSMTYNEWTASSGYYLAINPLNDGDCSTAFKVYRFKIYENDELVRDYVPASKDDTTGFYETVSGTYFDLSETEV